MKPVVGLVKSRAFRKNENVLSSTDKTVKRCQKGDVEGLLAVLAPFVSSGAGIFEISTNRL